MPCRISKTTLAICDLAPHCTNHSALISNLLPRSSGTKTLLNMTMPSKKNGPSIPWLDMATHTIFLPLTVSLIWIFTGPESNTLLFYNYIQTEISLIRKSCVVEYKLFTSYPISKIQPLFFVKFI